MSFWDSFSSAVDQNDYLSEVDKFNHLKTLVHGAAATTIAGLSLTSANYKVALDLLKGRFANKQVIISQALHGLAPKCKLINMHELINKSTNDYVTLLHCKNDANVNNKG